MNNKKPNEAVEDFKRWLNDRRGFNVSHVFHETIHKVRSLLDTVQEPTRLEACDALLHAAHAFFDSERANGMRGAVKWLQGDDGSLVIFTRGEYKKQLMQAVGSYEDAPHVFDAASQEQEDVDRLVREMDVALHGEQDAASQASLCDLVGLVKEAERKLGRPVLAATEQAQVDARVVPKLALLADWKYGAGLLWDVYAFGKWLHRVVSPVNWDAHGVYLELLSAGYAEHIDVRQVSAMNNASPAVVAPPAQAQGVNTDALQKALSMFPMNLNSQSFTINSGPLLQADGDDMFFSKKKVIEFLDQLRGHIETAAAQAQKDSLDAARYRWLAPRLIAADFDWNETGKCVLVFEWPANVAIGGNCDQNIDAAMNSGGAA